MDVPNDKGRTVKRFYYESHDEVRQYLTGFIAVYNVGRRLKTLKGLTLTNTSANAGQQNRNDSWSILSTDFRD